VFLAGFHGRHPFVWRFWFADAATGLGAPVYTTLLAELKKLKGI
jgi:hypothetical protein